MIREVRLRGFKRFEDESFPTAPLTLLTGFNSGGKSSLMHSLLLLHHATSSAVESEGRAGAVSLNAPGLPLGELRTVLNENTRDNSFSVQISTDAAVVCWTFGGRDCPRDARAVPVDQIEVDGALHRGNPPGDLHFMSAPLLEHAGVRALLTTLGRTRFIPADRFGPSETYPLDDPARHVTPGPRAERMFGNLHLLGSDPLPVPALRHPDLGAPPTIARQVEAWLGDLFPGIVLEQRQVPHANLMTLGIQTNKELSFHRPHNVGFGTTYVLPVVIALLTARSGDLVLLENPEAHLHPAAQARVGRLCAKAAAAGVQVVLETHSDHVLNGVRVAVHAANIVPEDVSILFFGGPLVKVGAVFQRIFIDRSGRLDHWPAGFFDEGDRLLDRLLEPVKGSAL